MNSIPEMNVRKIYSANQKYFSKISAKYTHAMRLDWMPFPKKFISEFYSTLTELLNTTQGIQVFLYTFFFSELSF